MKILIVGNGGREHALAWACAQSPHQPELFFAPGNPGMAELGQRLEIDPLDIEGLLLFAQRESIDLTVVGPETPLEKGLVDRFESVGLKVFGPSQQAAQMEASKSFAKALMQRAKVPTAAFKKCDSEPSALAFLQECVPPYVIKQDGLAGGKGVHICPTLKEAERVLREIFEASLGPVVIEEFLEGQEISVFAVCDGERAIPMIAAQDHKRLEDGDHGPNTGGMGAFAPVPWVTAELMEAIQETVLNPVIKQLKQDGMPYKGLLYAGLMVSKAGKPFVIEFNCRFGDPETQVVLPLLKTDLVNLMMASASGDLSAYEPSGLLFEPDLFAVTVVLCAKGYPGKPESGHLMTLPELLTDQQMLFHAGTGLKPQLGQESLLVTKGGRVMNAVGLGATLEEAIQQAYAVADAVQFEGKFYRKDIAQKGLKAYLK
jgi:phosphoribosylamine---glycine ligase